MASLRSSARPKRKRTANIQLSKQELQEYLDDGYTSSDIAKDFNVSPTTIEDRMRKFGIKKRPQRKKVARGTSSPRGRSPRRSSTKSAVAKSPRSSPRRAGRPRRVSKPPAKAECATTTKVDGSAKAVEKSPPGSSEEKGDEEPLEEIDSSLNTVVVQVIKDNPNDNLDHIHSLLKSMGFEFDKAYVGEHIAKTAGKFNTTGSGDGEEEEKKRVESETTKTDTDGCTADGEERKARPPNEGRKKRGRPRKQPKPVEMDKEKSPPVKSGSCEKTDDTVVEENEKASDDVQEERPKDDKNPPSENDQTETPEGGTDAIQQAKDSGDTKEDKDSGDTKEDADEVVIKTETVQKKRPSRKKRKPMRIKEELDSDGNGDGGGDCATEEKGSDGSFEPGADDKEGEESVKPKKRGRKRKNITKKGDGTRMTKRGRPSLQLSEENLKHCIDSGLPRQKIAEVFGTCMRSISRYLEIHKMRKSDKFCNYADEEIDEMISKISKEHPDWGQIHIQEDLKKKGLYFRRAQIRNSVRRVDPIGIELRKLNNLKRRWNRGSLKKLDSILPADGINMTSTDSFLCQPPRTGLNGLSQEDSVRLLKDIVYSSKREYVEYPPPFKTEESLGESSGESSSKEPEQQQQSEPEQQQQSEPEQQQQSAELIQAIEMVQVKSEEAMMSEKTGEHNAMESEEGSSQQEAPPQTAAGVLPETTAGVLPDLDGYWKQRLHSMVMSNKRAGRQAAAQRRGPEVKIPQNELQECTALGYSSSRLADKFKTSKHNVRRHLDLYKLGKSRRFEALTDDAIDEIVKSVIRDHGVLKGRDVYDKIKEDGLQIRKDDIRKSLCRLHPNGLHRVDPSYLKSNVEVATKDATDLAFRAVVDGNEEDVIVLDTNELAKLMSHEGGIVLVDEHGNILGGNDAIEAYQQQQQQQQAHSTLATIHNQGGELVVLHHQEGITTTQAGVVTQEDGILMSHQQHHIPDSGAAVATTTTESDTVVTYSHPASNEDGPANNQCYNETLATSSSSSMTSQHHDTGVSPGVASSGVAQSATVDEVVATVAQSQSDTGDGGVLTEVQQTHADPPPPVEPQESRSTLTPEESQISAIILEFNVPHEHVSGQGDPNSSQDGQYAATQEHSQEVYFIHEEQASEAMSRLVMVNEHQEGTEGAKESGDKEEHIIMQLTDTGSAPEGGAAGVSLTSLNTVQPDQLSAQVLLELDRIAHNLQSHEVKGEAVPVGTQESTNP